MHRVIRDRLEVILKGDEILKGDVTLKSARQHLDECEECRAEIAQMRDQSVLLRRLRRAEEMEPRAGFYARVMERIEAQGPRSIWNVFSDSPFGRRIAVASMALALAIGMYMFSAEQPEAAANRTVEFVSGPLPGEDQPGVDLTNRGTPDRDAVLVNLVTYREQ